MVGVVVVVVGVVVVVVDTEPSEVLAVPWVALLVLGYLSNAASFVLYGVTCLIRRTIEIAALFISLKKAC